MNILQACADKKLFAPWFKSQADWAAWMAFLAALFALPMSAEMLLTYQRCTGRTVPPTSPALEAWLICGRRAGKSFVLALTAVFLACFGDYRMHLAPGERGTVLVIATDRRQARGIVRYARGLLKGIPMLAQMVGRETTESFDLDNGVTIEVATASFKSVRGYTIVAALCDEIAFWPSDDAAEPDYAILDALRPGMATIPGAKLLCASSPYARRGALHDAFKRYFGKDDSGVLVWKADTRTMNPTVPQSVIDQAFERDPASASAEYGAEFRTDIASIVTPEVVAACVSTGVYERPPIKGATYYAFADPSGGSSDSMTLAISHVETKGGKPIGVLDAVREIHPPFSPETAVKEFAGLLRIYGIRRVNGDRYGAEWVAEAFRKAGLEYRSSELSKSEIYVDFLPRLNSREVDLLDNKRLIAQLVSLERRTARGGRDSIDHAPGSHDDLVNAAAGALVFATSRRGQTPQAIFGAYGSDGIRVSSHSPKRTFDGAITEGPLAGGYATTR
ncbi:terminase large subunit domain-containing protein [Bradyrhizobium sp. Ec3.3]|uniref:terminase large subunit domain-containing protein n=1 Tax=Bradyrhizobium sp. Ec3.3 TaxID=189753 RepID=UPI0003F98FDE|nr:terminase family protein [Bradyrhizobium sp. Ec3.3]